jgi:hypothetical protein
MHDMLERELQSYLYEHPEAILPGYKIVEKAREYYIQGKRIDLLFRTETELFLVELKAVPLEREHIGQIFEYYGLMRSAMQDAHLRMVLVAPSIPSYRKILLEEFGIRCVEMTEIPCETRSSEPEGQPMTRETPSHAGRASKPDLSLQVVSLKPEYLMPPVTPESLALSHRILRDSLPGIEQGYSPYEVIPIRMIAAHSQDTVCNGVPVSATDLPPFRSGGVWWAYALGNSNQMAKNDIPNISAVGMPWGFDLTINSELRTSQALFRNRIAQHPAAFDHAVREYGRLEFQAILKLECQPRFYFWIPLRKVAAGGWDAGSILKDCEHFEQDFEELRSRWIDCIVETQSTLTERQAAHMKRMNRRPNIALRLAHPFTSDDSFWSMDFVSQCVQFVDECVRLRPLIDLLR